MPVPVELRRVLQVHRELEERLAEQEGAEAGGEERHRQRRERAQCVAEVVVHAERVAHRLEVRDDRDLERHHQRREEHDEQRPLEREAEERERVAGEDRGHQLPGDDQAGLDEAVPEIRREVTAAPGVGVGVPLR